MMTDLTLYISGENGFQCIYHTVNLHKHGFSWNSPLYNKFVDLGKQLISLTKEKQLKEFNPNALIGWEEFSINLY